MLASEDMPSWQACWLSLKGCTWIPQLSNQAAMNYMNLHELQISVADLCLSWQRDASYDQCEVSIVVCIEHRVCLQPYKIKDFFLLRCNFSFCFANAYCSVHWNPKRCKSSVEGICFF